MAFRRRLRETRQIVRVNGRSIVLFEAAYRLLALPLLLRMADALMRFSLHASGYSYVTVNNLVSFLGEPAAIASLCMAVAVLLLCAALEAGCLVTAFQAAAESRRLSVLAIFQGGLSKTAAEVRRGGWPWFLIAAVHSFLIHLFLLYRLLCHVRPLKFILTAMMSERWGWLIPACVVALFIAIAVPTAFVGFGCMVEQRSFKGSLKRSLELLRGNYVHTALVLSLSNVFVLAAAVLLYMAAIVLTAVFAVHFLDQRIELALLLAARDRIEFVLIFAAGIALSAVHYGALTVLYGYARGKQEEKAPGAPDCSGKEPAHGRLLTRRNALGLLSVLTAVSAVCVADAVRNGGAGGDWLSEVEITAHRGSSSSAPENTIPALEAAIEELADFAEIDVQETADGELIVFHDRTLKRMAGDARAVASMTLSELSRVDVGLRFSQEFEGTAIPTLSEALEAARGRLKLNIELKNLGAASNLPEKAAACIRESGLSRQCVVTSTSLDYLRRIKSAAPEIYTGYIASAAYGAYYQDEAVDFVSLLSSSVSRRLVETVHECGKEVHVWTVNRKSELERVKLLGVDNVITDNPILARETLYAEENAEHLLERLREMIR